MSVVLSEYALQHTLLNGKSGPDTDDFNGVWYGAKAILFTNDIVPTEVTVLADLDVPTYTGYASQTVVWGTPYRRNEGGMAMTGPMKEFQMSDDVLPTTVYGYGIVNAAGDTLLATELCPGGPIQLTDTLSAINFAPEIAQGGPDFGAAVWGN